MNEKRQLQIAEALYRAYGASTDHKNYQGNSMPEWDALPRRVQVAWMAVAGHAVNVVPTAFPADVAVVKWSKWQPAGDLEGLNSE